MSGQRKKLAVLISGRGSNMEAILEATRSPDYPAEIAVVISDNPHAKGLDTAKKHGIETRAFARKDYQSRGAHESAIIAAIEASTASLICLAGYMRILSPEFVTHFEGGLINIHPSLLPAYKGLDTHARAIADGVEFHGCTVHFVNAEMDGGAIIAQAPVPVRPDDTEESLSARILKHEHEIYPHVIRLIASGNITLKHGNVEYAGIDVANDPFLAFAKGDA